MSPVKYVVYYFEQCVFYYLFKSYTIDLYFIWT
jgi:hypothetical protein